MYQEEFLQFVRRGGTITCKVTAPRKYSADLVEGGLEIPCEVVLRGIAEDIKKVKRLLRSTATAGEKKTSQIVVKKSPAL